VYITSAKIWSYKSFLETQTFDLSSGFNVIVGQNNAGKTALIEALSLSFADVRHRSLATMPTRLVQPRSGSLVEMQLFFEPRELMEFIVEKFRSVHIPIRRIENAERATERFLSEISGSSRVNFVVTPNEIIREAWFAQDPKPGAEVLATYLKIDRSQSDTHFELGGTSITTPNETLAAKIVEGMRKRFYLFRAERMNIGLGAFGPDHRLQPNASNLPEVLSVLQATNKNRFERFNQHVRAIFPHITQISIAPRQNNQLEILTWTVPVETERDDLAIPLTQSGTGVSQVLAILYVVMTAEFPQILLIDEPQSFLHPGAIRKLIEILKVEYPQHQYVLTTHSPHVISASNPGTLLLVKRGADQSEIESISTTVTNEMNSVLSDVGVRISDVFGADNIIWVEGPTEEKCFPLILQYVAERPLLGTALLAVEHTGDFETRKAHVAERYFAIYSRLTEGTGLVPPALAFIFDLEGRTPEQLDELRRRGQEKVYFLSRRLYENYLLDPEAIAACINEIDGFRDGPVTSDKIERWLEERRWEKMYLGRTVPENEWGDDLWVREVHGAKLLADLYADLSEQRVTYQKTAHSVALTHWLIEHKPEVFREIADMLSGVLDKGAQNQQ
jgi:predicted ATPase